LYLKLLGIRSKDAFRVKLNETIEAYQKTVKEVNQKKEELEVLNKIEENFQQIQEDIVAS
jgi:hypothetical protein